MEPREREKNLRREVFSMENGQCVWGRTGVIEPTGCVNAFDCLGCSLDRQVLSEFDEQRRKSGVSDRRSPRMLLMMGKGKCRHMLSGRILYASCAYAYNCARCPFDQMIEETDCPAPVRHPEIEKASDFEVGQNYYLN